MPSDFLPRFINGPFQDPGVFLPFRFRNEAILLDMGDLGALPAKEILKIGHVFVTHTHMDHFFGFDRLLRTLLGRNKHLHLYGPEGFLDRVEGKLSGYSWNLVENYPESLTLSAHEIREHQILSCSYACRERFLARARTEPPRSPGEPVLEKPGFSVFARILDHGIPVLGFLVKERLHVHIKKIGLTELELSPGPWLTRFKQALQASEDETSPFQVPGGSGGLPKTFKLGDLAGAIARIDRGQTLAYISDVAFHEQNMESILDFVQGVDHLFIEACFLEEHKTLAAEKHHLTARQAGEIAARAGAGRFDIFHFSPRYQGMENALYEEAEKAFKNNVFK